MSIPMSEKLKWQTQRNHYLSRFDQTPKLYREADAELVHRAMDGFGPDSNKIVPQSGMRVVCNISSAHIAAFFKADEDGDSKPYKNRYDLATEASLTVALGDVKADRTSLREAIDGIVAKIAGSDRIEGKDLYYTAIELNGTGIQYFGDICMVLKPEKTASGTLVLFKNSYDLSRSPIREEVFVNGVFDKELALKKAKELKGTWPNDVADMASCKILDGANLSERRMTTGMISSGVLMDEDYMEVVRSESFGVNSLEEIRLSSEDAAAEARIADRIGNGPTPSFAELQWRHRRRNAERVYAHLRIPTRVVATTGRTR